MIPSFARAVRRAVVFCLVFAVVSAIVFASARAAAKIGEGSQRPSRTRAIEKTPLEGRRLGRYSSTPITLRSEGKDHLAFPPAGASVPRAVLYLHGAHGRADKGCPWMRSGASEIGWLVCPEAIEAVGRAAEREPQGGSLEAVRNCLDGVTARIRSILTMRYREGMSGAEIARRTKTTVTAVHMALSRARSVLSRCVETRLAREEGSP